MRMVHLSDTHLGHSDYNRFNSETGINQREADIYRAFEEVVDHIVKTKPDLVIHAGDLFDGIRPSNRAISEAMEQLSRISREGIPTVVVAGNHSTPRLRSTDTIFRVLGYIPNVHPVAGGTYEKRIIKDCAVHCVPHAYSDTELKEGLERLMPDTACRYNVMVAHAAVSGTRETSWVEFKEQRIPRSALNPGFDYIALGHYHDYQKIRDNAYYCGSPERLSFREVGQTKGFLEVNLDVPSVRHIRTHPREMVVLEPIECKDLGATEVIKRLEAALSDRTTDGMVKVIFNDITRHVHRSLDRIRMRELFSDCLYFETELNWRPESPGDRVQTSAIGSLAEEFRAFLSKLDLSEREGKDLMAAGVDYLTGERERSP